MDIQGGELAALQGSERLLRQGGTSLIYSEVWFLPFYKDQPLFSDIFSYLDKYQYEFHSFYNVGFSGSTGRMTWADAIFVSPAIAENSRVFLSRKHGA